MFYILNSEDYDIMRCYNISLYTYKYSVMLQKQYNIPLSKQDWGIITTYKKLSINDYIRIKVTHTTTPNNIEFASRPHVYDILNYRLNHEKLRNIDRNILKIKIISKHSDKTYNNNESYVYIKYKDV